MNALHNLVVQGKVPYLVRWITALSVNDRYSRGVKGNLGHTNMDRAQSKPIYKGPRKDPLLYLPGKLSVLERSFERDIIPMTRAEGLALAPWDVLEVGKFAQIQRNSADARPEKMAARPLVLIGNAWRKKKERSV